MEMHKVSGNLKGLTVLNLKKESVALESLWKDRRVVLIFFRHFG